MALEAQVAVLGATGYTGRLVAHALRERGLPLILAGRDRDKLRALADELGGAAQAVCDLTQPDTLVPLLRGVRVLVSCAGPFTRLGEPAVAACVEHGVHYLDTTGEQPFVRLVYDRYDAPARARGCALVPSFAFEVALGDAAAALAARALGPLDELTVTYAVAGFGMSRGTQKSALLIMSGPGWAWQDGQLQPVRPAAEKRVIALPQPPGPRPALLVPYPEVLTVPRHVDTRVCKTYLVGTPRLIALMRLFIPVAARAGERVRRFLERRISAGSEGPSAEERGQTRFTIHVEARGPGGSRVVDVRGRDPYGLTAHLIAFGAERARESSYAKAGALAPAQAFDPEAILQAVAPFGVTVDGA